MTATQRWNWTAFSEYPPQGLHYNVLLYPFEEHLYVPSVPIQDGHFYCANLEVVSDEHYFFTRLLIIVADCPERLRVKCMSLWLSQTNGKVTSNTILAGEVFSMTNNLVFHVVLRSGNPIGSNQMEAKELIEVNIGLVHHIEGKRLWRSQFKFVAVMPSAICDVAVCWNALAQVKQGVHLHCPFVVFS